MILDPSAGNLKTIPIDLTSSKFLPRVHQTNSIRRLHSETIGPFLTACEDRDIDTGKRPVYQA